MKVHVGEEKLTPKALQAGVVWGHASPKNVKIWRLGNAITCVFCRTFSVNKDEGKCSNKLLNNNYFTHLRYRLFPAKKGKKSNAIKTPSRKLQAKGELCTTQTGKLCYNAININYIRVLVYMRIARELNLSSVMVLRKGVCSLFISLKRRSAVYVDTAG